MAFAILRTAKLKTMGNISASLSHNYRTRETLNADPQLTPSNSHNQETATTAREAIKALIPDKHRSDAVLCVEYLITASPEYFDGGKTGDEYFKKALEWLEEKHGKENVAAVSIHRDEKTPHMVAYVVPLDEKGGLNAKKYLGGRTAMSKMQTDFAKAVKSLGLERGIEGSVAKHTTIKEYYTRVNTPIPTPPMLERPKSKLFETTAQYGDRVISETVEHLTPKWKELVTRANLVKQAQKETLEAKTVLREYQALAKPFFDAIQPLQSKEREKLIETMRHTSALLQSEMRQKAEYEKQDQQRLRANHILEVFAGLSDDEKTKLNLLKRVQIEQNGASEKGINQIFDQKAANGTLKTFLEKIPMPKTDRKEQVKIVSADKAKSKGMSR